LVATCVAEEGLDIGEVDAVIFYDIAKDSIRAVSKSLAGPHSELISNFSYNVLVALGERKVAVSMF
jgi:hypothetical protein